MPRVRGNISAGFLIDPHTAFALDVPGTVFCPIRDKKLSCAQRLDRGKSTRAQAEEANQPPNRLASERDRGQRQPDAAVGSAAFEELHAMNAREQC
jgi:uncharacterized Zn finger protein (UPF0148 family)